MKSKHLGTDKGMTNSMSFVFPKFFMKMVRNAPKTKARKCKYKYCDKWLPISKRSEYCCQSHHTAFINMKKRSESGKPLVWRGVKRKKY